MRYDVKGRKYIGGPKKYYFEDVGLRNARLGFRQVEQAHIMEDIVYNEPRARGFSVDVGCVEELVQCVLEGCCNRLAYLGRLDVRESSRRFCLSGMRSQRTSWPSSRPRAVRGLRCAWDAAGAFWHSDAGKLWDGKPSCFSTWCIVAVAL